MGRRKIKIERITDTRCRNVTFHKRKLGAMKKAYELSVLCGADVAFIVLYDGKASLYSSSNLDSILARFTAHRRSKPVDVRTNREFAALCAKGDGDEADGEAATVTRDPDEEQQILAPLDPATAAAEAGSPNGNAGHAAPLHHHHTSPLLPVGVNLTGPPTAAGAGAIQLSPLGGHGPHAHGVMPPINTGAVHLPPSAGPLGGGSASAYGVPSPHQHPQQLHQHAMISPNGTGRAGPVQQVIMHHSGAAAAAAGMHSPLQLPHPASSVPLMVQLQPQHSGHGGMIQPQHSGMIQPQHSGGHPLMPQHSGGGPMAVTAHNSGAGMGAVHSPMQLPHPPIPMQNSGNVVVHLSGSMGYQMQPADGSSGMHVDAIAPAASASVGSLVPVHTTFLPHSSSSSSSSSSLPMDAVRQPLAPVVVHQSGPARFHHHPHQQQPQQQQHYHNGGGADQYQQQQHHGYQHPPQPSQSHHQQQYQHPQQLPQIAHHFTGDGPSAHHQHNHHASPMMPGSDMQQQPHDLPPSSHALASAIPTIASSLPRRFSVQHGGNGNNGNGGAPFRVHTRVLSHPPLRIEIPNSTPGMGPPSLPASAFPTTAGVSQPAPAASAFLTSPMRTHSALLAPPESSGAPVNGLQPATSNGGSSGTTIFTPSIFSPNTAALFRSFGDAGNGASGADKAAHPLGQSL
ncbi:hypothetical protein H9P43_004415 [Blastocladiella emersonii ATCC 22665]|nr:hypothetical protein H9P43_004415 [Blastocladiella emersonii ATCC 22665]